MSKTRRVAVIIDISWAYQHHHGVFVGTQQYARTHGNWDCIVCPHADPSAKFPGTDRHYDGIIARATPLLAARAVEAQVPLVNVFFNTRVRGLATVAPDRKAAGQMAAEHLLARGLRNFGFLGFRGDRNSELQLAGFHSLLQSHGRSCSCHLTSQTFDRGEKSWQKFLCGIQKWIGTWELPIGVFATLDLMARYLAIACREQRLNVPSDVALIGCQNEPVICLQPEPTLTSIDLGYDMVGYRAAELLDRMMDGARPPIEPITVPPKTLVPRHSTDIYATDDPLVSKAMRFMAEQGHTGISVSDVADAVFTSRRTLERRFSAVLGCNIAEELTRLKIERVKRQLVETDISIKSLAAVSGFTDGKQMGKTFTRIVGVSPQEYRRQQRIR